MGGDALEIKVARMEIALKMILSYCQNAGFGGWRQQIAEYCIMALK